MMGKQDDYLAKANQAERDADECAGAERKTFEMAAASYRQLAASAELLARLEEEERTRIRGG